MTTVLLVTSARQGSWVQDDNNPTVKKLHNFSVAVNRADSDIELVLTSLDQLEFIVDKDGVQIFDQTTKRDIAEYDVVHLRGTNRDISFYADYAKAIALYVEYHGGTIVDVEDIGTAFGKLSQAVLFALHDVPTPQTYAQWNGNDLSTLVKTRQATLPLIVKASMGTMGSDNYLVHTLEELEVILGNAKEPFIVQEMIANNGDYRVLLLGNAQPFVFWRPRIAGSHLSNTSQGSVPDKSVVLDPVALEIARRVREITGRAVVGVDIMQNNESGEWIVLEANTNPALATGAFNDDKAARYAMMIKSFVEAEEDHA